MVEKSEDWLYPNLETVFGEEILDLDPHGQYNVHFPMSRGELNVHSSVGGSLTCVLADLQEIWEYVLQCKMDIKLRFERGGEIVFTGWEVSIHNF